MNEHRTAGGIKPRFVDTLARPIRHRWLVLPLVVAMLAAACTGSNEDTGPNSDGVVSNEGGADAGGPEVAAVGTTSPMVDVSSVVAWSDPEAWPDGAVPGPDTQIVIPADRRVRLDGDAEVASLTVDGELVFDPAASATLTAHGNVIVNGKLSMRPSDPTIEHVIQFDDVTESEFLGGGMAPLDSDVGLWFIGEAQAVLEGSPRRGWTNAVGAIASGADTVEVADATGWQVGDEIFISPTAPPNEDGLGVDGRTGGFHETTIAAVDGNTITLADPTARPHPLVAGLYSAEVANLTRNVEVRGTETGRAHVFFHIQEHPQFVRWVNLDTLGVEGALGRYPLHFHHAGTGSVGSLIEGVVVQNSGQRAFVPHESHGITMRDLVAYDIGGGEAYWWDEGDETNDLVMEHAMAAATANSGFFLGRGTNVALRDAVSIGVENTENDGGFEWVNNSIGNWNAVDLVAHNNASSGIRVWQNADIPQVIDGYVAYHNYRAAVDHGAYSNRYTYRNGHFFGNLENGVILYATSDPTPITFENIVIDSAGITEGAPVLIGGSAIPANKATLWRNVDFQGASYYPIFSFYTEAKQQIRCIDCTWPEETPIVEFLREDAPEGTWLEIASNGDYKRYQPDGSVQDIEPPIDSLYGNGTGLTVEYFNNPDLTDLAYSALLPGTTDEWAIEEDESKSMMPYHLLSVQDGSSTRWSGELEVPPGEGDEYTLYSSFGGGIRLWIDDQLVIDDWDNADLSGDFSDPYAAGYNTVTVDLEEGRHAFKLEAVDPDRGDDEELFFFSLDLRWERPGKEAQIIPASQLYPSGPIPVNDPTPANPPG